MPKTSYERILRSLVVARMCRHWAGLGIAQAESTQEVPALVGQAQSYIRITWRVGENSRVSDSVGLGCE